ncbi:MAG: fibronectin type III domain-containing protein, partial [Planctomycetes bacterium]|nr:fibronectin type III domain-containing protein [Planctomycetota bacterium]
MPTAHCPCPALLAALLATLGSLAGPLSAQTPQQAAVQVTAVASTSPPSLAFTWPAEAGATAYTVYRRNAGAALWGPVQTIPGGGAATSWADPTVLPGQRYEYYFVRAGSVAGKGFLTAGVEAAAIEDRGKLVLLVDGAQVVPLGARLDRLVEDLTGDGWTVLRHDVPPGTAVPAVKALIQADVAAFPGQVKNVFVLGRIAVPYSGWIAPDGHSDHSGAWAADVFYGEVNGTWTDTTVNTTSATRPENRNVPGDGKYDQSTVPSEVDLGVGRVDFANMPAFAQGETALLQQYLDKDHDYRHKVFAVGQRALVDDNFGWFSGEAFAASGWRNFAALVGPADVVAADYFTTLNTSSGPGYAWSYGCGGGSYTSAGGIGNTANFTTSTNRCVFTMLFGSYFGDWDSTNNFLRAPLCSGWTLANAWAGRPHWSFHPMALGETLGYCARYSQNDTNAGGYGARSVHVALLGDPTLRQHVVAPPGGVAVADLWPLANVTWNPSADPVAGYHVYRAPAPAAPFTP